MFYEVSISAPASGRSRTLHRIPVAICSVDEAALAIHIIGARRWDVDDAKATLEDLPVGREVSDPVRHPEQGEGETRIVLRRTK